MKYDLIVVGGGPGGYVAAIKAAKAGLATLLIEKDRLGGTCLNRGCIPAKAMIHASEVYRSALCGTTFGIHAGDVSFDYGSILEYKQETIDGLVGGVEQLLKANGVEVRFGTGRLLSADGDLNRVAFASGGSSEEILEADNIILACGSVPSTIPVPGIDHPNVLDSDGLFALDHAPKSLVIIGGGVIGVEFATAFSGLGTRVTIIEALPKLLDNFDKEISQNLKMILKKRGVDIHTGAMVKEIRSAHEPEHPEDVISCVFTEKDSEKTASGEYILCAAGRSPVTDGIFEDGLSISMDGKFVRVDDHFRTDMPGVYAIGDLTGGIQLAHAASAHGENVIEYILGSSSQEMHEDEDRGEVLKNTHVIPGCVYTDPEIASVGLTEAQASDQGMEVSTGKFIMSANGKSLVTREERGFIKVVARTDTGKVVGAQMMCARATDMIGEFTTAIVNGLTVFDMLSGIRAHPTYNEGIGEALEDVFGESIHTVPKRRR